MQTLDDLILSINRHNKYKELVYELKKNYPIIPTYDYKSDNTEEWKANSLRKEGFDMCLTIFKIKLE